MPDTALIDTSSGFAGLQGNRMRPRPEGSPTEPAGAAARCSGCQSKPPQRRPWARSARIWVRTLQAAGLDEEQLCAVRHLDEVGSVDDRLDPVVQVGLGQVVHVG